MTRSISPEISSVAGLRSGIAAFIGDSFSHGRSALGDAISRTIPLGFAYPDGVWFGSGVSEVQAAFCTSLAAMYGTRATLTFAMLNCRACDSSNDLLPYF